MNLRHSIFVHDCKLQRQRTAARNLFINSGMFINLRRTIYSWIVISEKHPHCMKLFRSSSARRIEELKHMTQYRHMIHPFSMLSLYWEFLIFFCYCLLYYVVSIITVDQVSGNKKNIFALHDIIDIFLIFDIIKMFFTGYYDMETNNSVLNSNFVALHYLKTYFIVDLLAASSTMWECIEMIFPKVQNLVFTFSFRIFIALRILRLPRFLNTLDLIKSHYKLSSATSNSIRVVLTFSILIIWSLCIFIHVSNSIDHFVIRNATVIQQNDDWGEIFFNGSLLLLFISVAKNFYQHNLKLMLNIVFFTLGYVIYLYLHATTLRTWRVFSHINEKNHGLLKHFKQYMKYKGLPMQLRERIFSFFSFKFQDRYYNEAQINKMSSKLLNQQILMYITKNHISKVEFFQELPTALISKLVIRLKTEIYLTNDIILQAGVPGDCIYFIYYGTVAVYTPSGREICHLEDGAHFGEIALVFREPRTATVIAVTPCELFTLSRKDFLDVVAPFPLLYDKILDMALERLPIGKHI